MNERRSSSHFPFFLHLYFKRYIETLNLLRLKMNLIFFLSSSSYSFVFLFIFDYPVMGGVTINYRDIFLRGRNRKNKVYECEYFIYIIFQV